MSEPISHDAYPTPTHSQESAYANNTAELPEHFGFTITELGEIIGSESWRELTPNFPTEQALNPQELDRNNLIRFISVVGDPGVLADFDPYTPAPTRKIDGLGTLTALGSGEEKHGYLLTTQSGKKLAVLLQRAYNLPLEIPKDPRIYNRWGYEDKPTNAAYSDFRTYLSLPILYDGNKFGIHLQEAGGKSLADEGKEVTEFLEKRMIRQVYNQIDKYNYRITEWSEFRRADHYLKIEGTDGEYGVIDIPLDNRYETPKQMAHYRENTKRYDPHGHGRMLDIATAPDDLVASLPLPRLPTREELEKQY